MQNRKRNRHMWSEPKVIHNKLQTHKCEKMSWITFLSTKKVIHDIFSHLTFFTAY